jgi:ATP-binding protein involved in chromosome partitioning
VWRGPMASKVISQFLGDVDWGELDYLIVDLPPGTGDIQITLSQAARLSGAIIVMTPQVLATEIAKRGLKMFNQVRVPVIGIVENMSSFECPECHHVSHIFKQGGAKTVAAELGIPLLAEMPLDIDMVDEADRGLPVVLSRPGSDSAKRYLALATRMAQELQVLLSGERHEPITITQMEPNHKAGMFKVAWSDAKQSLVTFKELRYLCPCAACVDEFSGVRKIKREDVPDGIQPLRVQTVGNYALQVNWSDGHQSGIYSYDYLRRILGSGHSP